MPAMIKYSRQDRIFAFSLRLIALFVLCLLVAIIYKLYLSARPSIHQFGTNFIFSSDWNPVEDQFGALPFIFGTLVTSMLAIFIATPISIGVAIFINEFLPKKIGQILAIFVEMIAAVPSIVFGLWGIFFLAPLVKNHIAPFFKTHFPNSLFFKGPSFGIGIFAASLILSIMIIPTISSLCRSIFSNIQSHQKESALALGATKFEMIKLAVLSPSLSGITSAVILGLGRALGETMAVTMLIGNSAQISLSIFSPGATLASIMANEYAEASGELHLASLCYLALILFGVTLVVNFIAKFFILGFSQKRKYR